MPPTVRLYNPEKDEDAILQICRSTAHESLTHEPIRSIVPFIWAVPYIVLYPEYSFILDSGHGTAVGYILGTPSNKQFLTRYHSEYIPMLDPIKLPKPNMNNPAKSTGDDLLASLLQLLYLPDQSLLYAGFPNFLEKFPAHLHINLLPEYQGQGYGRQLMDRLFMKLKEVNVEGIHLVMARDNVNADAFYRKLGFTRFPVGFDDGKNEACGDEAENGNMWVVMSKRLDGEGLYNLSNSRLVPC